MSNVNLNQGQSVVVDATPNGQTNGTAPVWSESAGGTGLTITPAADGLSATVSASASAQPGVDTITVSGQRADGFPYHDSFTVTIAVPQATGFNFTFGTPTP
jgi:hypothetical protein